MAMHLANEIDIDTLLSFPWINKRAGRLTCAERSERLAKKAAKKDKSPHPVGRENKAATIHASKSQKKQKTKGRPGRAQRRTLENAQEALQTRARAKRSSRRLKQHTLRK